MVTKIRETPTKRGTQSNICWLPIMHKPYPNLSFPSESETKGLFLFTIIGAGDSCRPLKSLVDFDATSVRIASIKLELYCSCTVEKVSPAYPCRVLSVVTRELLCHWRSKCSFCMLLCSCYMLLTKHIRCSNFKLRYSEGFSEHCFVVAKARYTPSRRSLGNGERRSG